MKTECIRCGEEIEWNEKDFPLCQGCEKELLQEENFLNKIALEKQKRLEEEESIKKYCIYEDMCLNRYN